jgi:hypothetical protein
LEINVDLTPFILTPFIFGPDPPEAKEKCPYHQKVGVMV